MYRPCVGIVLVNAEKKVFVGARLDTFLAKEFENAWQMPQGGIDPGEKPEETALRELEEEVGTRNAVILSESKDWYAYDLPEHLQGKLWDGKFKGQRQKWFLMRFDGDESEINLQTNHPEFHAFKWVSPEEAIQLIVPFKRDLYKSIFEEFRHFF